MKKIPSSIKVKKGITYEVVWADLIEDNPETLAMCRKDSRQIVIKNGQTESASWEAFIHEYLHMLEFEFKIPIPHPLVYKLETAIFKTMKLNKWLD